MTMPLLTTKLYIPPVRPAAQRVPRPRLIDRLNAGLYRKLTLISASAGFGKTTLLSEWVHGRDEPRACPPFAWLSLDEGDNDPARFLAYFVAALQTIETNVGKSALSVLHAPQSPPVEPILTVLINEISSVPDRFIFVLDDYHMIKARPVHDALEFLLDHLPANMHLVIATRSDPPLKLARLRGRGQLNELRTTDLRFTGDEVTAFLNQAMGLELAAGDVAALASRTEGWIAGLQMFAISVQGQRRTRDVRDASGFVEAFTGSHRFILDYLVEEVLDQQSALIQEFLLKTCILDRLTGPLCDAILDGDDSEASPWDSEASPWDSEASPWDSRTILAQLEHANLFLIPLDDERRWYRYHRLFADLLRQRLRHSHSDQISGLHRRASAWYEQHGLMADAIEHALSARDRERAARLIDEHAETLWGRGEQTTLSRWLEGLSEELVCARPKLCIYHALLLFMSGQLDKAERRLQDAERVLGPVAGGAEEAALASPGQSRDGDTAEQRGKIAAVRAYIAFFQGDIPAIIQFSRQALECLPEEKSLWRGFAAMALGDAHLLSGDAVAAGQAFSEAVTASQASDNVYFIMMASQKLADNQRHQGRLQRAGEICRQQLRLVKESGFSQTARAGSLFAIWGEILREWNDLDQALHYVRKAVELCEQGNNVVLLGSSYLALTKISLSKKDLAGAEEAIRKLEKLAAETDVPVTLTLAIPLLKSQVLIAQGKPEAATQLFQGRGLNVEDDFTFLQEAKYVALARRLIAQGEAAKATRLLERLLRSAEAGGRMGWAIAILTLQALAFSQIPVRGQAQGDVPQALASLQRALALAEPEGYVRTFVEEGEPMARLLRQAVDKGIMRNYAGELLAVIEGETKEQRLITPAQDSPSTPSTGPEQALHPSPLVEPLSERELEVLRLLTTYLSSTEIAAELTIAPSTARSHIKHIYAKLDVHSRMDAVQRAKELGLL